MADRDIKKSQDIESKRKAAANDVPNYTVKKQRLCDVQDYKRKVDETVEPRYPSKKQRVCGIQEKGPVGLPFQVIGVNDNQSADGTAIGCLGTSAGRSCAIKYRSLGNTLAASNRQDDWDEEKKENNILD
ncbi:uncharacterized protein LOC123545701 [Mercenaria mercenaria]|uniref:uncharacterized protein LOC123545701 n=1 Tax=Mercenaria mercenaria TaxID=6596 RepID=UPI00234E3B53|nr:uncharacterized protein LOC123545701 [Mercenaria mercenaria]